MKFVHTADNTPLEIFRQEFSRILHSLNEIKAKLNPWKISSDYLQDKESMFYQPLE